MTIYVSIGNSDDKLTQEEWSFFQVDVDDAIKDYSSAIFGSWVSRPYDPWQNACWGFECHAWEKNELRRRLVDIAKDYRQDSIAWVEGYTQFIVPSTL